MGQEECTPCYLASNPNYICGYMMFSWGVKCHRKRSQAALIEHDIHCTTGSLTVHSDILTQWPFVQVASVLLFLFIVCNRHANKLSFQHSMSMWLVLYYAVCGGVSLTKWKVTKGISCCNLPGICRPALKISMLLGDPVPQSFKVLSFSVTTFLHQNVLNTYYTYNFNLASPPIGKTQIVMIKLCTVTYNNSSACQTRALSCSG